MDYTDFGRAPKPPSSRISERKTSYSSISDSLSHSDTAYVEVGRGREQRPQTKVNENSRNSRDFTFYSQSVWLEKQQKAFTVWINHIISTKTDTLDLAGNPKSLNSKRWLAKIRGAIARTYHKDEVLVKAMLRVEASIEEGRVKMLKEGGLLEDVRMKKRAIKTLMCYNPFWLRLGLETVFHMSLLQVKEGTSVLSDLEESGLDIRSELISFVEKNLLADLEIKQKMKKNFKMKDQLKSDLGDLVLKRFLLLVILLDRTQVNKKLPPDMPLLFETDKDIKSSADMVRTFLKGSIFGEGDTLKQLEYMGYLLTYQQKHINEYNFTISNLATDLRDGLRLGKLAEYLFNIDVLNAVNWQTGSHAVKAYNVRLALGKFEQRCKSVLNFKDKKIRPEDIVNGHRERSLCLLWNIAYNFQCGRLVTNQVLEYEIYQIMARSQIEDFDMNKPRDPFAEMLLKWVNVVVRSFGAIAKNFNTSFADGSILCFLICYYLPGYLRAEDVYVPEKLAGKMGGSSCDESDETTDSSDNDDIDNYPLYTGKGWMDSITYERHRAAVYKNFSSVSTAMRALGGVPELISASDFETNGPEEKCVILYLCFLCARLLDVSKEDRAAVIIQRTWKKKKGLLKENEEGKGKKSRGKKIEDEDIMEELRRQYRSNKIMNFEHLRYWHADNNKSAKISASTYSAPLLRPDTRDSARSHKSRSPQMSEEEMAAIRIQSFFRSRHLRQEFLGIRAAALVLQSAYRVYMERKAFLLKIQSATVIQKCYRMHVVRSHYVKIQKSVEIIQSWYFMHVVRNLYIKLRSSTVIIQSHFRMYLCRRHFLLYRNSAICIQSTYRMYVCHSRFLICREAAVRLQAHYKMRLARRDYLSLKQAIQVIQVSLRRALVKRGFTKTNVAASLISANIKMMRDRDHFLKVRSAAITVQTSYRGYVCRREYEAKRRFAIMLQSYYKMVLVRRRFLELRTSTIIIQSCIRMHLARAEFLRQRAAAVMIQKNVRGYMERKRLINENRLGAVVVIQKEYKRYLYQKRFKQCVKAAIKIQAAVRCQLARKEYLRKKQAVSCILNCYRWYCIRRVVRKKRIEREAATKIQAAWRGHQERKQVKRLCMAIAVLQRWFAARIQRRKYVKMCKSALILQKNMRMLTAKNQLKNARSAAVLIQSVYRRHVAMRIYKQLLREKRAAMKIQSVWRGYLLRCYIAQIKKEFSVTKKFNVSTDSKAADMKLPQMAYIDKGLAASIRDAVRRAKATITLQAYARGMLVRKNLEVIIKEFKEAARIKLAVKKIIWAYRAYKFRKLLARREAAALVLQKWRLCMIQRMRFLKIQKAVDIIKREWYLYKGQKYRAAIVIKKNYKMYKAIQYKKGAIAAIIIIQTAWRGYVVRCQSSPEVREICRKISIANRDAKKNPNKSIGIKSRQAVKTLKNIKNIEQAIPALAVLASSSNYSRSLCRYFVESNALDPMFYLLQNCNKSPSHRTAFKQGLQMLKNICKNRNLLPMVFYNQECLATLSERLQYYRDYPEIFEDIMDVFDLLFELKEHREVMPTLVPIIEQWNSVASLLARKVGTEKKYINRLEGDKGSDKSAKTSTKKVIVSTGQLARLHCLFAKVNVTSTSHLLKTDTPSSPTKGKDVLQQAIEWQPKNMIAKQAFKEVVVEGPLAEPGLVKEAKKEKASKKTRPVSKAPILGFDSGSAVFVKGFASFQEMAKSGISESSSQCKSARDSKQTEKTNAATATAAANHAVSLKGASSSIPQPPLNTLTAAVAQNKKLQSSKARLYYEHKR